MNNISAHIKLLCFFSNTMVEKKQCIKTGGIKQSG